MQLEFQGEGGTHQDPAQGRFAHARHVLELHVKPDCPGDLFDLFAREPQPLEDANGHFFTDALVVVEMDPTRVGIRGGGDGFGDIVQQHRPRQ